MEKYGKISIVNETRQAERQRIKRTPSPKCLGPEICLEDMMMEKIKFVMTDTGAQVSALCRQALEAKGVAVTVCEKNGDKALETLLNVHPQAALLDAFMPDLDAITVKQRYEAQNTSGTRTTFFVTGAFQSEEMEQEQIGRASCRERV